MKIKKPYKSGGSIAMEKTKKMTKKVLSVIMAILMLIVSIPMYAYATGIEAPKDEEQASEGAFAKSEVIVLGENESLREENIKYFDLSDGTSKAVMYSEPIHYKNSEGKWVDIDNALTLNGSEYSAKNKLEIKFANKSDSSGLLSIKDSEYKIDFTPLNTNKVSVEIENAEKNNSRKFDDVKKLTSLISKARYSNIYDGVDIEYILVGNNVKENIIVKEKRESYSYSYELKLNKLNAELINGAIILSDSETNEAIYKIPAPYMLDANGEYSEEVEYTLTKDSKWKYTFTVTASKEWINEENRAFPITIDPTVVTSASVDTCVLNDNGNYSTAPIMIIGSFWGSVDSTAFVKFNSLPQIPSGYTLVDAKAILFAYSIGNDDNIDLNVGVFETTQDFTSATYATRLSYFDSGAPVDYLTMTSTGAKEWNITSLYEKWMNGTANNGIAIKTVNAPNNADRNAFVQLTTKENTYDCIPPQLEVTYATMRGIEDIYSYFTSSAGSAGTGYVNAYTGELTFVSGLTTTADEILPYSVGLVYNSVNNTWMNSFDEKVEVGSTTSYRWTDSDGTIHYFTPYRERNTFGEIVYYEVSPMGDKFSTSTPTEFYDELGLGLMLKKVNGQFVISDDKGNKKTFNSNGKLAQITDTFGNKRTFTYTDGKLTATHLIPNTMSAIAQLTFTYDADGHLIKVVNNQAKMQIDLTWSSSQLVGVRHTSKHNGSNEVSSISYTYDAAGRLTQAKDVKTGKAIEYVYNNKGKVGIISELANNGTTDVLGQMAQILYEDSKTTYAIDGVKTVYVFDSKARVATVYSCDSANKTIYGSSSYAYYDKYLEENVGPKKHNKLKNVSSSETNSPNLLVNPTFDTNTLGWSVEGGANSAYGSITNVSIGSEYINSVKIQHATNLKTTLSQPIYLEAGEYTFSAYFNRYEASVSSTIKLSVLNSIGAEVSSGVAIPRTQESSTELEDYWEREELRITITTAGTYNVAIEFENTDTQGNIIYIDNAMLEKGSGVSTYSYFENGDFDSNSLPTDNTDSENSMLVANNSVTNDTSVKLTSNLANQAYANQYITIPAGSDLDGWIISAWARAQNSVASANNDNTTATFGIRVSYEKTNEDGTTETVENLIPFNPECTEWQYVTMPIAYENTNETDTEVTISLVYEYNIGEAYFDKVTVCNLGSGTSYEYNGRGKLTKVTDPNGMETTYGYANGNGYDVTSVTNNYGTTSANYDNNHNLSETVTSYSDGNRLGVIYQRNSQGQIISTRAAHIDGVYQILTQSTYISSATSAAFSKISTVTDERGNVTKYYYTSNGLVSGICLNNDDGTIYEYDAYGQLVKVSQAKYNAETSTLEYATTENSGSIEYSYNSKKELQSIVTDTTDYSFAYDIYGNLTSVKIAETELTTEELTEYVIASYTYEANNGNLRRLDYGNGTKVYYLYDNLDRVIGVCYNSSTEKSVIYTYAPNGQISAIYDLDNSTVYNYYYDGNGNLTNERVKKDGKTLYDRVYSYDNDGRLTGKSLYCLEQYSSPVNSVRYTYDEDNRLEKIENASGEVIEYTYDVFGRVTNQKYNYDTTFSYEKRYYFLTDETYTTGLVSNELLAINNSVVGEIIYTYDEKGNITEISYSDNKKITYVYDDKNQLIRENNQRLGKTYVYTYDNSGNILSKATYAYTTGTVGTALSTDAYSYTNESWGDLLTSYNGTSITYDSIGNPLSYYNGQSYIFTWQEGRQLASAAIGDSTYNYKYNQDGIRVEKTVGTKKYEYTLDGNKIVRERILSNNVPNRDSYFYYDANGHVSSANIFVYDTDATYEYTFVFRTNIQGDVVEIYREDGTSVVTYTYDAYGNFTETYNTEIADNIRNIASDIPFRYRGYTYDKETGLYYLNSRYYDPKVGRFISADDIGYLGANGDLQAFNLFAYCSNNPVMYVDNEGNSAAAAVMGFSWLTAIDGFLPIFDIILGVGLAAAIAYDAINSDTESKTESETKVDENQPIYIYRYGGTNPSNFVPSERDVANNSGLSFSTIPPLLGQKAGKTTIEELNATGIVYAVRDGKTHVSVYPIGGTISEWRKFGVTSIWTLAIRSVIMRHTGK